LKNLLSNAWSRYVLAAFAGLLLAAAFPGFNIAGLAWIAPALMLVAANGTRGWESFRIGYVAGFSFWLASLYWLLLIPVKWLPILGWVALCAFIALHSAVWVWLVISCFPLISTGLQPGEHNPEMTPAASAASTAQGKAVETASAYRASNTGLKPGVNESADEIAFRAFRTSWLQRTLWSLFGAAAWVALEMIRARLLGGFPWNLLGVSQFKLTPLIQITSITGVYGVSFLVVWTSLSLFNAAVVILRQPIRRFAWQGEILLPFVAVVMAFVFGFAQLKTDNLSVRQLNVALVQPSIPQTVIWDARENANRFNQLIALSDKAAAKGADVLVWPEAALPGFDDASYIAITNLIRTHRLWMIFGADDVLSRAGASNPDEKDYFNAAFLFNPDGQFVATYHKRNLVIFGEYIPFTHWLPFLKWFTTITDSYASGDKPVTFELERRPLARRERNGDAEHAVPEAGAPIKTSPLICYEDMFPQLGRDSVDDDTDFLVNLTNDGWFGEAAEQWQHANAAGFRAIENGLPLLRCCNNGVTCWIDSRGRMQQIFHDERGSVYGVGSTTMQIPILAPGEKRARTFYNQHGDWFGWSCVVFAVVAVLVRARQIFSASSK
jgi:apolipoprotein N-acyltransferase